MMSPVHASLTYQVDVEISFAPTAELGSSTEMSFVVVGQAKMDEVLGAIEGTAVAFSVMKGAAAATIGVEPSFFFSLPKRIAKMRMSGIKRRTRITSHLIFFFTALDIPSTGGACSSLLRDDESACSLPTERVVSIGDIVSV